MQARLHPSFVRALISLAVSIGIFAIVGCFLYGERTRDGWIRGFAVVFGMSFVFLGSIVCMAWVPSEFECSETHLTVRFPFRQRRTLVWDDLECHGWGEGIYGLQFKSAGSVDFYPQAFPRREWKALKTFLSTEFPNRKSSGFRGARFFRWLRNKA